MCMTLFHTDIFVLFLFVCLFVCFSVLRPQKRGTHSLAVNPPAVFSHGLIPALSRVFSGGVAGETLDNVCRY